MDAIIKRYKQGQIDQKYDMTLQSKQITFQNDIYGFDKAIACIKDITNGIRHLHQNGLCHLNIHPDNIFIDSNDRAIVGGFEHLTRTDTKEWKFGTSAVFRPPEAYNSIEEKLDGQKFDIWSLGILAAEVFTGQYLSKELSKWTVEPTSFYYDLYGEIYYVLEGENFMELVKKNFPNSKDKEVEIGHMLNFVKSCLIFYHGDRPSAEDLFKLQMFGGDLEKYCPKQNEDIWAEKLEPRDLLMLGSEIIFQHLNENSENEDENDLFDYGFGMKYANSSESVAGHENEENKFIGDISSDLNEEKFQTHSTALKREDKINIYEEHSPTDLDVSSSRQMNEMEESSETENEVKDVRWKNDDKFIDKSIGQLQATLCGDENNTKKFEEEVNFNVYDILDDITEMENLDINNSNLSESENTTNLCVEEKSYDCGKDTNNGTESFYEQPDLLNDNRDIAKDIAVKQESEVQHQKRGGNLGESEICTRSLIKKKHQLLTKSANEKHTFENLSGYEADSETSSLNVCGKRSNRRRNQRSANKTHFHRNPFEVQVFSSTSASKETQDDAYYRLEPGEIPLFRNDYEELLDAQGPEYSMASLSGIFSVIDDDLEEGEIHPDFVCNVDTEINPRRFKKLRSWFKRQKRTLASVFRACIPKHVKK